MLGNDCHITTGSTSCIEKSNSDISISGNIDITTGSLKITNNRHRTTS